MDWSHAIDADGGSRTLVVHQLVGDAVVGGSTVAGREALRARASTAAVTAGLATARDLTLDEYTLASVMASEHGNGSPTELACLGDATLNRAARAGQSVFATATDGRGFGRGRGGRPMTTANGFRVRHLRAALALTRGGVAGPRGVARGAYLWMAPRTQAALVARGDCPPLTILERWCFSCAWADVDASGKRTSCRLGPRRSPTVEWVGPVADVDAMMLMLFRPASSTHAEQYAAARAVIHGAARAELGALATAATVLLSPVLAALFGRA